MQGISYSEWLNAVNDLLIAWGEAPVNTHEIRYRWVEAYSPSETTIWTRRGGPCV